MEADGVDLLRLLNWAKGLRLFIEIMGDGSAEVQIMDDHENYSFYEDGDTLLEALRATEKKFLEGR